jgi:hypothetical protein
MAQNTKETGKKISYVAEEPTHGPMEESMTASGRKISFMASVSTHGLMANATQGNTWMILNTAMEFILGQMESATMVAGKVVSNTGRPASQIAKERPRLANGKTEIE